MKNKLKISAFVAVAIFCSTNIMAQAKPEDGFTIKGTLKGITNGSVVLLRYNESDRTSAGVDSAVLKSGTFVLKGKLNRPEMMNLVVKPGNWGVNVFVENSEIRVEADTTGAQHYDYTKYGMGKGATLKKVKVTGSVSQDQFSSYENAPEQVKFNAGFRVIDKKYTAEKDPVKKKKIGEESEALRKLSKAWQYHWINDFVAKNPSSTAGLYIFNNYHQFDSEMPVPEFESIMNRFTGKAKMSVYYASLMKELNAKKALLPGNVAPDFTLLKRDSTTLTLSSTRGKYIMLDFWASWCHPCREAIPHWKAVYQKYHDKGFEIVSVSDDSKWKNWTDAMDIEKMPWTQVIDEFALKNMPARVGSLYQTHFIPFYVLLDKEGKILVYSGEEKDIDSKLAALLD